MSEPAPASPLNDNGDDAPDPAAARVFVRVINTHPGPPWSQSQQAAMEARLGAPARLEDITYRLRRLDAWRPRGPARFAAVYVRAEDARNGLVTKRLVEGHPLTIDFTSPVQKLLRFRGLAGAGLAALMAVALAATTISQVIARRTSASISFETTERLAASLVRRAQDIEQEKQDARRLDGENMSGRRLEAPLADLEWAARRKSATAHIQALHWDHGFLAVEAQGDAPPFQAADRPVERAKTAVRPGVWLWGVGAVGPWQDLSGDGSARTTSAR